MPSASGLSLNQRIRCRDRAVQAAKLAYANRDQVSYTQGAKRWNGITNHRDASVGLYTHFADCSSFVTWCLWNGLVLLYGTSDVVNGANWKGGWTGTMYDHGMVVRNMANVLRGDCVLYGASPGLHVTIVVDVKAGTPMVISHGSEPGPYYLPFNYRPDVHQIRRYI